MMQNFVFFLLPNPQVVVRCSNTVNQIAQKVCKTLCFPKAHIIPYRFHHKKETWFPKIVGIVASKGHQEDV
jgi:hypothetical protein